MNMTLIRRQLEEQRKEQERLGKADDKQRKSDAKPLNDDTRRHSLGPDLLWEEIP